VLAQLGIGPEEASARMRARASREQRLLTGVARDVVARRSVFTEETGWFRWSSRRRVHGGDHGGSGNREQLAARASVELADTLVDDYDMIDLLDRLVSHSVRLLSVDAAAIMLADGNGGLRTVASSSEDAELMEVLQLQSGQGPCVDCVRTASAVAVTDLAERAVRRGEVVAEQLQTALDNRVVVEQAKGVVAQHSGLPMDQAFERLRRHSRRNNRRLVEAARDVVTGRIDPAALSGHGGGASVANRPGR
jgi:hypothetical protein